MEPSPGIRNRIGDVDLTKTVLRNLLSAEERDYLRRLRARITPPLVSDWPERFHLAQEIDHV